MHLPHIHIWKTPLKEMAVILSFLFILISTQAWGGLILNIGNKSFLESKGDTYES